MSSIWLIARFELMEALRSKRVVALVALYVLGAGMASWGFCYALNKIFAELPMQVAMVQTLSAQDEVKQMLKGLVGDSALVDQLLATPPVALFYAWLAMAFAPFLIVLTAHDAISSEVQSGAVRYALFRTTRLHYVAGKLIGQALMMTAGIVAGALAFYVVALVVLDRFEAVASIAALVNYTLRSWFYSFAFLGLAIAASQLVKSQSASRGAALALYFSVMIVSQVLGLELVRDYAPWLVDTMRHLVPGAYYLDLWHPKVLIGVRGMIALLVLGCGYAALGYWRFSRRDA